MQYPDVTCVAIGKVTGFYVIRIGARSEREYLRTTYIYFPPELGDEHGGNNKTIDISRNKLLPWWQEKIQFNSRYICLADWIMVPKDIKS